MERQKYQNLDTVVVEEEDTFLAQCNPEVAAYVVFWSKLEGSNDYLYRNKTKVLKVMKNK